MVSSSGAASHLLATHTLSSPVLHRLLRDETAVSIRSLRAASPRAASAIKRRSTSNEPSCSNHRVPRRRDEPIAAAGLLDVAEPGEREVIAETRSLSAEAMS